MDANINFEEIGNYKKESEIKDDEIGEEQILSSAYKLTNISDHIRNII